MFHTLAFEFVVHVKVFHVVFLTLVPDNGFFVLVTVGDHQLQVIDGVNHIQAFGVGHVYNNTLDWEHNLSY